MKIKLPKINRKFEMGSRFFDVKELDLISEGMTKPFVWFKQEGYGMFANDFYQWYLKRNLLKVIL